MTVDTRVATEKLSVYIQYNGGCVITNEDNMPSKELVPAEPKAVDLPKCFQL